MANKKPLNNQARKRQIMIAGGVITLFAGAFLFAINLAENNKPTPRVKEAKPAVTRLDSPGTQAVTGPSYESALDAKMSALRALVEESQANASKRQDEAIAEALARARAENKVASNSPSGRKADLKVFDPARLGESLPKAPPATLSPPVPGAPTAPTPSLTTMRFDARPQVANVAGGSSSVEPYSVYTPNADTQEAYRNVGRSLRGEPLVDVTAKEEAKPNTQTYLPSGTFFRVTNLNGLDAPTGGQAQNNPVPMLLNVTGMGQLPNRFKADVKQCFVTAQGWGDLSAERAYIRTESLSCVRRNGEVIDIPIQGYVVGGDGKVGLRGRVVSKQGQVLANALWVSMLASFGEVSKAAATTVNVSSAGTITANTGNQSTSDLLRQGALSGLGEAAKTLSNYYISLAEKLWPVIEIDPGQGAEIVLSRGSSLLQQPGANGSVAGLASISDQLQGSASSALDGLKGLSSISPTINLNLGLGK